MRCVLFHLGLLGISIALAQPVQAQITTDGTLGTTVSNVGNNFAIDNGTIRGNNLFHSFSQFSIPTSGSATFSNATNVQNIFSRITGETVSNIDGIIRANGTANLFLLNPNGILFGHNAQLNIGGSFISTTAQLIKFADGIKFSAINSSPPLLTVSAPIGLQFGQNPAAIVVHGQGHQIQFPSTFAPGIGAGQQTTGLRVNPDRTLALIGGEINFTGGVLSAPSGRIELGSVADGNVSLGTDANGVLFGYDSVQAFRDIQLADRSAIDATGFGTATVQLVGRKIALTNGSVALMVNQASQPGGNLQIQASELFQLSGRSSIDPELGSFLISDAFAGSSANISITAPQILMFDRGIVAARTFAQSSGGNININASEIQIDGKLDNSLLLHTGFLPTAMGIGNMGEFALSARNLSLLNGGYINASTFGSGNGAKTTIRADTIRLDGVNQLGQSSIIAASSFSSGNAGNLTIDAREIMLTNGGTASTSTFATGKAGNITLKAAESITVAGRLVPSSFSTTDGIGSAASILPLEIRQLTGLPDRPSGNSGDVVIQTTRLNVINGGAIKVENQGSGDAGTVRINAALIQVKNQGSLSAATTIGDGGNVVLQAQTLLLRDRSSVTTTANGIGNGGNISIHVPVILGLKDSDIVANAVQGRGGSIEITTQSIIGLQYRDRLTSESDITASSQFGVNGTVEISNFGVDPKAGLVELPVALIDDNQQIAEGCSTMQGSSFVITGRGGIPPNPIEQVNFDRTWSDLRDFSNSKGSVSSIQPSNTSAPIVEATSWQRNPITGEVKLIAAQPTQPEAIVTCALAPNSQVQNWAH